ncbi:hypothetical protein EMCRGX_G027866 [Ephydatia muelleri]
MYEISLKRVIANEKEKARIIRACHDGVDGCHYGSDKTRAKDGVEEIVETNHDHDDHDDYDTDDNDGNDDCDDHGDNAGDDDGSFSPAQDYLMQNDTNDDVDDKQPLLNHSHQSDDRQCHESVHCSVHALHEQFYSPQLLRLWRSAADKLCHKAEEDED